MGYYLGIVGMANGSEASLASDDGREVKFALAPPLSMRDDPMIKIALGDTLNHLGRLVGCQGDVFLEQLVGACFAMTGIFTEDQRSYLRRILTQIGVPDHVPTVVCENCDAHLAAAFLDVGCVVRAGTGSEVFVRTSPDEAAIRVDGWGDEIGDCGSGYWLGIECIRRVFKGADMRARCSESIRRNLFNHIALASESMDEFDIAQWFHDLRNGSDRRSRIAQLAIPLLASAENDNDDVACEIVEEGVEQLLQSFRAAMLQASTRKSFRSIDVFPIVLHGSVFRSSQTYRERFRREVQEVFKSQPKLYILDVQWRSSVGALALAMSNSDHVNLALDIVTHLKNTASSNVGLERVRELGRREDGGDA